MDIQVPPKTVRNLVETIDDSLLSLGTVTQETMPLEVAIWDHQEVLQFRATRLPHFPLMLSILWPVIHDPYVLWHEWQVSFHSEFCQQVCLMISRIEMHPLQALAVARVWPSPELTSALYTKISDYGDVLKNADILPPHRDYECPIKVQLESQVLFSHIYTMCQNPSWMPRFLSLGDSGRRFHSPIYLSRQGPDSFCLLKGTVVLL